MDLSIALPPPWIDQALCAQVDPEIFYPEKGMSFYAARRVCASCPVVAQCLEYAIENREEYGLWGGTTPKQRATLTTTGRAARQAARRERAA